MLTLEITRRTNRYSHHHIIGHDPVRRLGVKQVTIVTEPTAANYTKHSIVPHTDTEIVPSPIPQHMM